MGQVLLVPGCHPLRGSLCSETVVANPSETTKKRVQMSPISREGIPATVK